MALRSAAGMAPSPPPSGPSASNAPRKWPRQHGPIEAPRVDATECRSYWRATPQVDRQVRAEAISWSIWICADRLRVAYALAHRRELRQRGLGTASFSSISIATRGLPVPQAANCRRLRCWHGSNVAPARMRCPRVCVAVVDCSWCELARRSNVLPKTVRGWTLAALEALAALWGARPPF